MVKVVTTLKLTDEEEKLFSVVASIAKIKSNKEIFTFIGRFRRAGSAYALHKRNIKIVLDIASGLKDGEGLAMFALRAQEVLDLKINTTMRY